MRTRLLHGGAVLLLAVLALPLRVSAQHAALDSARAVPLIDVPYVPQSEALCGGAALAMVLRFWGERAVHAEQFASLVVDGGILTTDLVDVTRALGWRAEPFRGTAGDVQSHLARGWPVIALIEDRPGWYHYVVIVAWANGRVLYHDPARAPMRVATAAAFEAAWRPTAHWALLVLPAQETGASPAAEVRPALAAVLVGDAPDADSALVALREHAGAAFRGKRYGEAAARARTLVARAPGDAYGWQLLASARYLLGDDAGALSAWNRIGRPVNDLTRIDGLRRTRHAVVARAVGVQPGALITPAALGHAYRRVRALPGIAAARVDYRPVEGGRAEVHAAVVERALLPHALPDLLAHGARGALEQRVRVELTNAFGAGDVWYADGVWQEARRAVALGVALPHAFGTAGVWRVIAAERTLTHAPASVPGVRETHRSATVGVADWANAHVRWSAAASYDEWRGLASYGGAHGGVELRSGGDRAALRADIDGWMAAHGRSFVRTRVRGAVRSPAVRRGLEWDLAAGAQHAPSHAPRAVWAGAGSGPVAHAPLRAHTLYNGDGEITSRWFAPQLAHASAEARFWLHQAGPLRFGVAVFMDGARVRSDVLSERAGAFDAGIGLRADVPGLPGGIRFDVARSLSDNERALSIGWAQAWPGW